MIVNLAMQTRQIIADAKLNVRDIQYVIFYNDEASQYQYCSYSEFMETAEDIDYDQADPTFIGRRIIQPSLAIVAESWWLRRTTDDEETEDWVFQEIPMSMDDMQEGSGELDVNYIIADIDALPSDYADLVGTRMSYNEYVQPSHITICGKQYTVDDSDGIDKVYDDGCVAVIVATDGGQYWTYDMTVSKDPRMIFHPELVKLVMEESYVDLDTYNNTWIADKLGISTNGFSDESFLTLGIRWIPRGTEFMITYDSVNDTAEMCEQVMINPKTWLIG